MTRPRRSLLVLAWAALGLAPVAQDPPDTDLRAAVERFFAAQAAEDVDGYFALWSRSGRRPTPEQLRYVFDAGDDSFSDISILNVARLDDRVRVLVAATRDRRVQVRAPSTRTVAHRSKMLVILTYVREGEEWKLVSEGPASDEMAAALVEAPDEDARDRLLAAESVLVTADLVAALSRLAGQAAQAGAYAQAELGYQRMLEVARRIGDRKAEGEALQNVGNARYFQRRMDDALAAYEERLPLERERGDEEGIAAALAGIATIRYTFAEYSSALMAYRAALDILERLGDLPAAATTLISTGNILYLQGDYDAALAEYARSRDLHVTLRNPAGESEAWKGLGRVFTARGDYAGALEAFTRVLAEGQARGDRAAQGAATLSLGEVHLRLGNLDAARGTFEEGLGHFEATKDVSNVGRVWQAIALTDLMAGRPLLAEEGYSRSMTHCDRADDRECSAGARAGLAYAQAAQDKFAEAIRAYGAAIEIYTALKQTEAAARAEVGLSEALAGDGRFTGAVEAAARARRTASGLGNDDVLWRALVAEARALRGRGDLGQAASVAQAAVYALDRLVEGAEIRPASPVPSDSTAVFATLAVLQAESGNPAGALAWAERLRVHALRATLARAEREIARGMTPEEQRRERELAVELVSLHARLAREKSLPKPDIERTTSLERRIADAEARQREDRRQLFQRLPELPLWRGLMTPVAAEDLTAVLEPGTALVEFVVDDRDLVAITAARGADGAVAVTAASRRVARRELAERIGRLLVPATLASSSGWRSAARELMELLPANALAALETSSRVIVVPDGILWRIPVEALPLGGGSVADSLAILYASSATALVRAPHRVRLDGGGLCLAAGAPDLARSLVDRLSRIAPSWSPRAAEAAAAELAAISDGAGCERLDVLAGADLTEEKLREQLPAASAIHLAAPFRINSASPLFSAVLLAGVPAPDRTSAGPDAMLEVREVFDLDLRARLAVLSDGAAMAMREAADDVATVQWAWRAAGVPVLLVARWPGDAAASSALLTEFHRRIVGGASAEDALRAARDLVRRRTEFAAPFYWGGWLLIGDSRN